MYTNNLEQLLHFIYFMIIGILLSIIFDIFRILRKSFKTTDLLTNIEDALFGFITGILLIASIFWFNNGQLRFYILISFVSGIFLYMLFLSKYFIKIGVTIVKSIKSFLIYITNPIVLLFKRIKRMIFRPIRFIFINFKQLTKKVVLKIKKITKRQKKDQSKEGF